MSESNSIIDRLRKGMKPTELLREIKADNPEFTNYDISDKVCDYIGVFSLDIIQPIWYWKGGGRSVGYNDEQLDAILLQEFEKSNLL